MKKSFLLFAVLLLFFAAKAQLRPLRDSSFFRLQAKAALRARSMGDSIVLRWALTAQDPWPFVQETGFDLERVEMDASNKVLSDNWVRLNTEPLKPISPTAFKALIDSHPEDENLKAAAGMVYGALEAPIEASNPLALLKARADEAQNRYGFMLLAADFSPRAAEALGLRYVDKNIVRDHRYVYRLIVRPTGGGYPQDTALCFAVAESYTPLAPPLALAAMPNDKAITLSWRSNILNPFSAYWIERSKDGEHFERLNKRPFLQMRLEKEGETSDGRITYRDSIPRNYERYYYRVLGISAFGETSAPSALAEGNGVDKSFSLALNIEEIKATPKGPRIAWRAGDKPKDLKSFQVLSASSLEGDYQPISPNLPPAENAFVVQNYNANGAYYQVVAFDTAGNRARSLPLYYFEFDTIPPPVPVVLSGFMDTNGGVHLQWPKPRDGDTRAFRLYYANDISHEPNPLLDAPITDTVYNYQGNANTLTKALFIRIAAVDANGNHSALSAPFRIRRPDRVPPTDAVISNFRVTDTAVTVFWQRSNSDDVASQTVLRRPWSDLDGQWQKVATLAADLESYTDTRVKSGEDWAYAILTTDSSNLNSPVSFPLRARIYAVNPPAGIGDVRASALRENGRIELAWSGRISGKSSLLIARSYNGVGFVPVARLNDAGSKWTDDQTVGKGTYQYRIRQIAEDGTESAWTTSNEVRVE